MKRRQNESNSRLAPSEESARTPSTANRAAFRRWMLGCTSAREVKGREELGPTERNPAPLFYKNVSPALSLSPPISLFLLGGRSGSCRVANGRLRGEMPLTSDFTMLGFLLPRFVDSLSKLSLVENLGPNFSISRSVGKKLFSGEMILMISSSRTSKEVS